MQIIKLSSERWKEYKQIRLHSLQTDPEAWEHTLEMIKNYPDEKWQSRLEASLQERGEVTFFAETEGRVVGMVGAFWAETGKTAHHATIVSVYVLPEYRHQDMGNELMQKIIEFLISKNRFVKLKLTIVDGQKEAMGLYKKFGFAEAGRLSNELFMDGKFFDEILMEKAI